MCGRYTLVVAQDELEARFDAPLRKDGAESSFSPRYNMAPGQQLPVITNEQPETIRRLEW
ncbi:MAG: SOS response-associated peptidase family protein, partial [Natrinema limicola]